MNNSIFPPSITKTLANITTTTLAVGVLMASTPMYKASAVGFNGAYDPNNWTLTNTNADGYVDIINSTPNSIRLTGGNNGSLAEGITDYTITVANTGTWSFNWLYQTADELTYDYSGYLLNNVFVVLSDGTEPTSDLVTQSVNAGDIIGFRIGTADNGYGAGSLTVSNFDISSTSEPVPEPLSTAGVLLFVGGVGARKLNQGNWRTKYKNNSTN